MVTIFGGQEHVLQEYKRSVKHYVSGEFMHLKGGPRGHLYCSLVLQTIIAVGYSTTGWLPQNGSLVNTLLGLGKTLNTMPR